MPVVACILMQHEQTAPACVVVPRTREMALSRRDEIDRALRHALNADTPRWGVRVDHIKLGKLVPLPTH